MNALILLVNEIRQFMWFFFSKIFRKRILQSNSQNLEFPNLQLGAARLLLRVFQITLKRLLPPNMTAQNLVVLEI